MKRYSSSIFFFFEERQDNLLEGLPLGFAGNELGILPNDLSYERTTLLEINKLFFDAFLCSIIKIQACWMSLAIATILNEQDRGTAAARGQQYNGRRPNNRGQRVSYHEFPDLTDFGRRFTGSCEGGRAEEFFRRKKSQHGRTNLISTAQHKLSRRSFRSSCARSHSSIAKGGSLSPTMYRAILQNPRHHTGNRCYR